MRRQRPRRARRPGRGSRRGRRAPARREAARAAAARVHGPAIWSLSGPVTPWACASQRVEVLAQVAPRRGARRGPARSTSRQPDGCRSTCRSEQERGRAPEQVGARPAGRQLGQVRQVRQLAQHDRRGLARVGAGHRADAGRHAAGQKAVSVVLHAFTVMTPAAGRIGGVTTRAADDRSLPGHVLDREDTFGGPHRSTAACGCRTSLPQWSSRAASAARYDVGDGAAGCASTRTSGPGAAELDGSTVVSSLQTGVLAGPARQLGRAAPVQPGRRRAGGAGGAAPAHADVRRGGGAVPRDGRPDGDGRRSG